MITYNYLYEARRKEKSSNDLTPLPQNFFKEVEDFFNLTDDEDVKKQAQQILNNFIKLRMIKIAQRAILFEKEDTTNLLDKEIQLYKKLKEDVDGFISDFSSSKKGKLVVVKFNADCNAFLGSDMKPYGPFKKEDLATIPIEQALTLKKQNIIDFVED